MKKVMIGVALFLLFPLLRKPKIEEAVPQSVALTLHVTKKNQRQFIPYENAPLDFINIESSEPYTVSMDPITYGEDQELCFLIETASDTTTYCDVFDVVNPNDTLGYDYRQDVSTIVQTYYTKQGIDPSSIAYFYYDPQTGEEVITNPDQVFLAASTVKVPLSMLYIDLIEEGIYSYDSLVGGMTIRDLITASIRYSNNETTEILFSNYGTFSQYREALKKYADVWYPETFHQGNEITSAYALEMMKYLFSHQERYQFIIDEMLRSTQDSYFRAQDLVDVAHKYGSYLGYEHDIAIFQSEDPFLAGVYSTQVVNAPHVIGDLGAIFYEYHQYHEQNKS